MVLIFHAVPLYIFLLWLRQKLSSNVRFKTVLKGALSVCQVPINLKWACQNCSGEKEIGRDGFDGDRFEIFFAFPQTFNLPV